MSIHAKKNVFVRKNENVRAFFGAGMKLIDELSYDSENDYDNVCTR
jgi:hypothetical protein